METVVWVVDGKGRQNLWVKVIHPLRWDKLLPRPILFSRWSPQANRNKNKNKEQDQEQTQKQIEKQKQKQEKEQEPTQKQKQKQEKEQEQEQDQEQKTETKTRKRTRTTQKQKKQEQRTNTKTETETKTRPTFITAGSEKIGEEMSSRRWMHICLLTYLSIIWWLKVWCLPSNF